MKKGKGVKDTSHWGFLAILNSTGGIVMENGPLFILLRKAPPQVSRLRISVLRCAFFLFC